MRQEWVEFFLKFHASLRRGEENSAAKKKETKKESQIMRFLVFINDLPKNL